MAGIHPVTICTVDGQQWQWGNAQHISTTMRDFFWVLEVTVPPHPRGMDKGGDWTWGGEGTYACAF